MCTSRLQFEFNDEGRGECLLRILWRLIQIQVQMAAINIVQ